MTPLRIRWTLPLINYIIKKQGTKLCIVSSPRHLYFGSKTRFPLPSRLEHDTYIPLPRNLNKYYSLNTLAFNSALYAYIFRFNLNFPSCFQLLPFPFQNSTFSPPKNPPGGIFDIFPLNVYGFL